MSISHTSIKKKCPFSPPLWGFVSRLLDECPRECLLIARTFADGPRRCSLAAVTRTEYAWVSSVCLLSPVAYFV